MTRRGLLTLNLLLSLGVASCSAHHQAGTGDIAFRLLWEGQSDLDLLVVDPDEQCLSYLYRTSDSGGLLDVDCNGGTGMMCTEPIENVYWPVSTAPTGSYTFWIEAHSLIPAEAPLPFEVQLLRGSRVVWRQAGTMVHHQQIFGPLAYGFPHQTDPILDSERARPECVGPHPAFGREDMLEYDPNGA